MLDPSRVVQRAGEPFHDVWRRGTRERGLRGGGGGRARVHALVHPRGLRELLRGARPICGRGPRVGTGRRPCRRPSRGRGRGPVHAVNPPTSGEGARDGPEAPVAVPCDRARRALVGLQRVGPITQGSVPPELDLHQRQPDRPDAERGQHRLDHGGAQHRDRPLLLHQGGVGLAELLLRLHPARLQQRHHHVRGGQSGGAHRRLLRPGRVRQRRGQPVGRAEHR